MNPFRNMVKARNLLIGAGAYYLAAWLTPLLAIGYDKLTHGIIYSDDFEGAVVMPLVLHLPKAIVAAATGAVVVWLVESERPLGWTIFPVLLYAVLGFFGYHWARPPVLLDRVEQTVAALFPAVTCAFGGMLAARRRTRLHSIQITPG
ncbi:MAG: hypothetical protein WB780_10800 [Candidatus Acidiferrales bacterium]